MKTLYWVEEGCWLDNQLSEIENTFDTLNLEPDKKAAIGAGASGLLPEFNLLLIFSLTLIGNGFLTAIGEDAWKLIKRGVVKILETTPAKMPHDIPSEYQKGNLDLIWWMQFDDVSFMVALTTKSTEEAMKALDMVPVAIDRALLNQEQFSRIVWIDNEWKLF